MNRSCVKPTTHYELLGQLSPTGKKVFVSQRPAAHVTFREASRPAAGALPVACPGGLIGPCG